MKYLRHCGSECVDCVITDPPYWTLNKWRQMGTTTRLGGGYKEDSDPDKFFDTIDSNDLSYVIAEIHRVLRKNAHAWLMCDGQALQHVLREGFALFDYVKPFPVIKMDSTSKVKKGQGYHGRCSHEYVVLLEKGRRRFSDNNAPDVFMENWCGSTETRPFTPDGKPFPTAKPVSLFRKMVELSTSPGEMLLDPFAGSGTLGAACDETRSVILVDASERAYDTMLTRLLPPSSRQRQQRELDRGQV